MSYLLRKNYTSIFSDGEKTVRAKLAFKTKDSRWLDAEEPVVILMSIYSAFHEKLEGQFKMEALIRTIRNHVRGRVTLLLADRAHIRTQQVTLDQCIADAFAFHHRFNTHFAGCEVVYWHAYICQDPAFPSSLEAIHELYHTDGFFKKCLQEDAEDTNKEEAIKDIMEQCACILVLSRKGVRFQFHPGDPYASTEYVNRTLLKEGDRVEWIKVFLSIEKKINLA